MEDQFDPCAKCSSCGGSAHPASGCQYTEDMIICGRCTRLAWNWIRGHTNLVKRVGPKGSKQKVSFYEAAARNRPKDNGV
jgi:hypothetical protein